MADDVLAVLDYLQSELNRSKDVAGLAGGDRWSVDERGYEIKLVDSRGRDAVKLPFRGDQDPPTAEHLQQHSPGKVLEELVSKQQILDECRAVLDQGIQSDSGREAPELVALVSRIIHMLALPYRNARDFPVPLR
ncbi:DUF6221 family protein [Streptomyces sp. NPDC058525]|uniref:DUF6221 family protein n=1 Tax=Streptomyces sp. NPDC058525 TaxID=3346538 RepID=UPI003659C7E0